MANHANQFGVKARVDAKGDAAADSSEDEEAETPDPGHSSWHFLGEVVSLSSANWTHQMLSGSRDENWSSWGIASIVGSKPLIVVVGIGLRWRRWGCIGEYVRGIYP